MLLGVVAAGALYFFMRTVQSTSQLQRTQAAATVATQGMERVRAINPQPLGAATMSPLLAGRTQTAVLAAWNAADPVDIAQTAMEFDPAPMGPASVPVVSHTRVSDMDFTVTTHIGSCYRPIKASASNQSCTTDVSPSTSVIKLYRVTVVVTWEPGKSEQCNNGTCVYRLSTLIDVTADAEWNVNEALFSYDSEATYTVGDVDQFFYPPAIQGIPFAWNPTDITTFPLSGQGSAWAEEAGTKMGAIGYKPPGNYSGPVKVMYTLDDHVNPPTTPAALNITVLPKPFDDSGLTVERGKSKLLPVLGNDLPTIGLTPVQFTPVMTASGAPATGATVMPGAGGQISLSTTPLTPMTTLTFTYRVQDATGGLSLTTALVNVTVVEPTVEPPTSGPKEFLMTAVKFSSDGSWPLEFGLSPGQRMSVVSPPTKGSISPADGTPPYIYSRVAGEVGVFPFTFRVFDLQNNPSVDTYPGTLVVRPVASTFTTDPNGARNLTVSTLSKNIPSVYNGSLTYVVVSKDSCDAVTVRTDLYGAFSVQRPQSGKGNNVKNLDCSFTYRIVMKVPGSSDVYSDIAKVTVQE